MGKVNTVETPRGLLTLEEDGTWSADSPSLQSEATKEIRWRDIGPGDGTPQHAMLAKAARYFGGTAHYPPPGPDIPKGCVP